MIPNYRLTIYVLLILDIACLIGMLMIQEQIRHNELVQYTQEHCAGENRNSDLCTFLIKAYL